MRLWPLVLLFACGEKKSEPPPPSPTPKPIDAAAIAIDAPPPPAQPITVVTDEDLGISIVGLSHTRPVVITTRDDNANKNKPTFIRTNYLTGEVIDRWSPDALHELAWSPWRPGKSPKLDFDLEGRLAEIRKDLATLDERLGELDPITIRSGGQSADFKQVVLKGGDLLFYLAGDKPVLLENGASYNPVLSPDEKRVAYSGCGSPCGKYALRIATLGEKIEPRRVPQVGLDELFWGTDGNTIFAMTDGDGKKKCVVRVDTTTLAATNLLCDGNLESIARAPKSDMLVALLAAGDGKRELRTFALPDGKETFRTTLETKVPHDKKLGVLGTLSVSQEGKIFLSLDGELHLVDPATKRTKTIWRDKRDFCYAAEWADEAIVVALCSKLTRFDTKQLF